jgi:hypothetical protein
VYCRRVSANEPAADKPHRKYAWVLPVLLLGGCVYLWELFTGESDENVAAGKSIVAAIEAFNGKNGRYPEKLEELVPRFLPEIPQAGQYFGIYYAAEPGGTQCWLAYGVHRDRVEEYDCSAHTWINLEVDDSAALRHPAKQVLSPAQWRRTQVNPGR